MIRRTVLFFSFFLMCFFTQAQIVPQGMKSITLKVNNDSIRFDSLSISPGYFKVYSQKGELIPKEAYQIDFASSVLVLSDSLRDAEQELRIVYEPLPDFLTRKYSVLDQKIIAEKTTDLSSLYNPDTRKAYSDKKLFGDLYTSGNLSRGVTFGNNQDAVVNSNFNLQIEGNLSENVGIRASITDNNIPVNNSGYTQRLDEYDRVFIELYGKNWKINAGDVYLQNNENYYLRFNKKVAGVSVEAEFDHGLGKTRAFASGALVRGKFTSFRFNGVEGNQGPYKITGEQNEQFFLIVSGSETVYANGIPLKRGENFDYIINYNTGEITFTTLYPVNANMRFTIDFQIVENNYTRFVTYDGVDLKSDKLRIGVKYFNESDSKNKPTQIDLTDEQKQILAEAGDDNSKMVIGSATPKPYSENKILYIKKNLNGKEYFEYSANPGDELYEVKFSYVGENKGDYEIETTLAPGRVYRYIEPANGQRQGAYAPVIRLIAPQSMQIADLDLAYDYSEKGSLGSEIAVSSFDQNLFSPIDNDDNQGFAGKLNWHHTFIDQKWQFSTNADYEFISSDFKTIERFRNVEFNRDWNILESDSLTGTSQSFLKAGLNLNKQDEISVHYQFENLRFQDNFKGYRHLLRSDMNFDRTKIFINSSVLQSRSVVEENAFYRWFSTVKHNFKKSWIGGKFNYENNRKTNSQTELLNVLSHKLTETEVFAGIGDSVKVFTEIGYNFQVVDSVRNNSMKKVNDAHTFYIHSKLIHSKNTDLAINGNYRTVENVFTENEKSINGRLLFRQNFLKNMISYNMIYETQSGNLPQQDFSYVEVEPGKGFYTWIDFNNNNIQELDEFVVAKFQDEAIYLRVLLPNITFISTHRNKFSQALNLSGSKWQNSTGFKKVLSHFSNQTYFLIDANERNTGGRINFNPFVFDEENLLALNSQIKNSLFFNRGLQHFSTGYIFLNSRKKSYLATGDQDNQIKSHQLQFAHKIHTIWLVDLLGMFSEVKSESVTFSSRNYRLENYVLKPKLTLLYSKNTRFEAFYTYKNKENQIADLESLTMHVLGTGLQYSSKQKFSVNAGFNWIDNKFSGNRNSPVAYQMLEGLQPGKNMTWNLGVQKRLLTFLDLNISYFGRKSESSGAIHTGTVQLRASF